MDPRQAYQFGLLPLAIWREARGTSLIAMIGVGFVIKNRVSKPGWWGNDWPSVILKKFQFSSFNWDDPNSQNFPKEDDERWKQALMAAQTVWCDTSLDPTGGATYYFDKSLDSNPPEWSKEQVHTCDIGPFHFYK